jgi:Na+/H+-translocating membrane pyrophosphatase
VASVTLSPAEVWLVIGLCLVALAFSVGAARKADELDRNRTRIRQLEREIEEAEIAYLNLRGKVIEMMEQKEVNYAN